MELNNILLKLKDKSITIDIEIFSGVLTERTFTGENCYRKLLDFLAQIEFKGRFKAEIDIG